MASSSFKYFNLNAKDRVKVEEPKDRKTWIAHGISEFIGTFVLSMMLAGLGIKINSDLKIESFLINDVFIGLYAGFVCIPIVLIIFLRWSCDLNPGVTVTRMLKGTNTYKYGFFKIGVQFLGGTFAGLLVYGIGHSLTGADANGAIDSYNIVAADKAFFFKNFSSAFDLTINEAGVNALGTSWIFILETIIMMILLWPIFSHSINDKYRDFLICVVIAFSVLAGILGGSAGINPARGFAQQVPALFFGSGSEHSLLSAGLGTMAMMAGGFFAPFVFVWFQGLTETVFNPLLLAAIRYKNNRSDNMRNDSQIKNNLETKKVLIKNKNIVLKTNSSKKKKS